MIRSAWIALCLALGVAAPAQSAPQGPETHHDVEVHVDPDTGAISLNTQVGVSGRDRLDLRFADWLKIKNVSVGGRETEFTAGTHGVSVPLSGRDRQEVTIRLSGLVPDLSAAGRRGPFENAVAGPDGVYLSGYSGWMPLPEDEEISYRLTISVPQPYRAVSSGRLSGEASTKASYQATFEADRSLDPPSLFIGPYEIGERVVAGTRIRTYFHEEISGFSDDYIDAASEYLALFSEEIGAYPYDDFHIVSSPLPVGLGFVNLTYIGQMIVPRPFMRGQSLAHEILHNWWGNGVFVKYREGNWSEGLTTFMADYALARTNGAGEAARMRLAWLRDYAALPESRDGAVRDFISKRHQAAQVVGYNKAAHIFHMLEAEIGEDAFSDAIRLFWSRYQFSTAGWSDLQDAFETTSGRDLGWFFDQWLDRRGAPELSLAGVRTVPEGDGHLTTVKLRQSGPLYRLRVPVEIVTATGTVREDVEFGEADADTLFRTDDRPLAVRIDPSFDLFRRLLPGESAPIMRDVTLGSAVNLVVLDDDTEFGAAVDALVPRLLDRGARISRTDWLSSADQPLVVAGRIESIAEFARENGIRMLPLEDTQETGAAWMASTVDGRPVLLLSAQDADALRAMNRALPHYGRQSYVVFSGGSAARRGVWEVESSPLTVELAK